MHGCAVHAMQWLSCCYSDAGAVHHWADDAVWVAAALLILVVVLLFSNGQLCVESGKHRVNGFEAHSILLGCVQLGY